MLPTVHPDFSLVRDAKLLANDKSEAYPTVIHLVHILQLSKLLEEPLLVTLANANSSVLHLHQHTALLLDVKGCHFDEAVCRSEFECVLD